LLIEIPHALILELNDKRHFRLSELKSMAIILRYEKGKPIIRCEVCRNATREVAACDACDEFPGVAEPVPLGIRSEVDEEYNAPAKYRSSEKVRVEI
jgi:hypothetical protein